ncbi:glycine-rich protein DOT1-like isoform X1 [Astatotilapia calliptera]|uniref:glycine-rich protein DOT1-like isoform X1 n=2 Tax=Astatotilapia calliptera TaxID=8154 RepID=UPI000E421364|nr:glycine-rich protein DOT1-like isoform X1 [Astatotilapia calliptera]
MGLKLVLKVSCICFLLFSSGSCFPQTMKGQTSPAVTASARSAGTNPGHDGSTGREAGSGPGSSGSTGEEAGSGSGPNGSTGGELDSGPEHNGSAGGEVSSAGGWSFGSGSSNGGGVDPGSAGSTAGGVGPGNSAGSWSISPGSSTGGGVGPGNSAGSWSFSPGSSTGVAVGPGSSPGSWSFNPGSTSGGGISSSAGHWSFIPGSSTGVAVGPGGWSFGLGSSSGGWVGPRSSPGGWSFAPVGPIGEVRPTWSNGYSFLGGVPYQNYPVLSSSFLNHPWNWMPPRPFPDFNAWSTYEVPLGMVALLPQVPSLPSSHLVQTGTGYQRGREVLSHSKYSNNILGHHPLSPVLPQYPRRASGFQGIKV